MDRNAKRSIDGVAETGAGGKWWNASERGKEKKLTSITHNTLAYPFVSYLFDCRAFAFSFFTSAHTRTTTIDHTNYCDSPLPASTPKHIS